MTQMYQILSIVVLLLITGCSRPIVINPDWACNLTLNTTYIYITNTTNNTIYRDRVNQTVCDPCIQQPCRTGGYSRIYVNSLLREIKILQWNQDKFWNYSDCLVDLNNSQDNYMKAKEELCNEWNASWC